MIEFDKLYLSWRKGQGARRHIVGVLAHNGDDVYAFSYDQNEVEKAAKEGFIPYTEFPDVSKTYNGNALEIFAQRLIKSERPDIQTFYDFWEIEPKNTSDKFYMLGHTQGLQPTDNFEFLADYNIVTGLHFLTELAGLSKYQIPSGILIEGDVLRFELDKTNQFDPSAVKIFKGDIELGYVKKVHCKVFNKSGAENLKLTIKAVDKNGVIKRVFIKVAL